jgi:hypothetical protein
MTQSSNVAELWVIGHKSRQVVPFTASPCSAWKSRCRIGLSIDSKMGAWRMFAGLKVRWLLGMIAAVVAGATFGAAALASTSVPVHRCRTLTLTGGKLGIYPWHLSCAAASRVVRGSFSRHAKRIQFTGDGADTFDGGAVRIEGRWWVCGGRMGYYFCGYPYRPAQAPTGTSYSGPFTRSATFETCDLNPGCPAKTTLFQPPKRG